MKVLRLDEQKNHRVNERTNEFHHFRFRYNIYERHILDFTFRSAKKRYERWSRAAKWGASGVLTVEH